MRVALTTKKYFLAQSTRQERQFICCFDARLEPLGLEISHANRKKNLSPPTATKNGWQRSQFWTKEEDVMVGSIAFCVGIVQIQICRQDLRS